MISALPTRPDREAHCTYDKTRSYDDIPTGVSCQPPERLHAAPSVLPLQLPDVVSWCLGSNPLRSLWRRPCRPACQDPLATCPEGPSARPGTWGLHRPVAPTLSNKRKRLWSGDTRALPSTVNDPGTRPRTRARFWRHPPLQRAAHAADERSAWSQRSGGRHETVVGFAVELKNQLCRVCSCLAAAAIPCQDNLIVCSNSRVNPPR